MDAAGGADIVDGVEDDFGIGDAYGCFAIGNEEDVGKRVAGC